MININEQIPDMELMAYHDGKERKIKLSDYRGSWLVLFFYPADFTFVCPTELEEMANMYEDFQKYGAEIVSVSTDTHFVHKAWHDTSKAIGKIKYPMVADPTGKLARAFGTYLENEGLALRGTFIIDPDGILKSYEINDNSLGRSGRETLRKMKAAKYVRENEGEVCPASWEPGDDVLKPSLDLVGKI
jgi:NADH-dependent peroxiredoxin subunit C